MDRRTLLAALSGLLGGSSLVRPAAAQDQPVVHLGLSTFEAQAEPYYALELGIWKRVGLNLDIQQYQGGEAIVTAIVGNGLQIGAGNPLPLANAHEHGLDVMLIAPGTLFDAAQSPFSGLLVATDGPVHSGRDLNGKTIGVNTLHSVDTIASQAWVDQNGGDSSTLKFIEVPSVLMTDAVAAGRIAGGVLADPGFTLGLASGKVRSLANINAAIAKRFMITAWFATRTWAEANPDVVRKFDAGVNEAATWAVKNPEAAAGVLRKYMRLTPPRAHERHARSLDPALLQPLFDAAVRYKVLAQPIDARTLIWTPH